MPTPSKGPRREVKTRVPEDVREVLEVMAANSGASSLSQYVADLLSSLAGRPDLVREIHQEVMPMPLSA